MGRERSRLALEVLKKLLDGKGRCVRFLLAKQKVSRRMNWRGLVGGEIFQLGGDIFQLGGKREKVGWGRTEALL